MAALSSSSQLEAIPPNPPMLPEHGPVLEALLSFQISDSEYAYEIRLRGALSAIWSDHHFWQGAMLQEKAGHDKANQRSKP